MDILKKTRALKRTAIWIEEDYTKEVLNEWKDSITKRGKTKWA